MTAARAEEEDERLLEGCRWWICPWATGTPTDPPTPADWCRLSSPIETFPCVVVVEVVPVVLPEVLVVVVAVVVVVVQVLFFPPPVDEPPRVRMLLSPKRRFHDSDRWSFVFESALFLFLSLAVMVAVLATLMVEALEDLVNETKLLRGSAGCDDPSAAATVLDFFRIDRCFCIAGTAVGVVRVVVSPSLVLARALVMVFVVFRSRLEPVLLPSRGEEKNDGINCNTQNPHSLYNEK